LWNDDESVFDLLKAPMRWMGIVDDFIVQTHNGISNPSRPITNSNPIESMGDRHG
jgi:hypothetical protein